MSGNIFVSSTVPGINDRDRDKQVVSLFKQPYYLSRTDNSTAYWVKFMIGSTLLMLVVPIFLAHLFLSVIRQPQPDDNVLLSRLYPLALRPDGDVESDAFQLAEIPISAILTQALTAANGTRSRGLLAHALLELQNPELTCFAGLGYGVHLKEMNKGAKLEAFPDGKVPRCGVGGRYDDWGRVRGLRYAYQRIATGEQTSLVSWTGEDGPGSSVDTESLLMGWPALLLERAEVSDPLNPVPPGSRRNVYGEAVDRVVRKLCAEGRCNWNLHNGIAGKVNSTKKKETTQEGVENAERQQILSGRSEGDMRPFGDSLKNRTESVFVLPSFLALYAVARQDRKWLVGAVEQIRAHFGQPVKEKSESWMTDTADALPTRNLLDAEHDHESISGNSAWLWAGVIRVLGVLEKWRPKLEHISMEERITFGNWRNRTIYDLKEMINTFLVDVRDEQKDTNDILRFCGHNTDLKRCKPSPRDPARTALLVSSVYRLAQLNMLNDLELLQWVDGLYNAVARHVGKEEQDNASFDGTSEDDRHDDHDDHGGDEDHIMVVMMWAARRDCVKAGACSMYKQSRWWDRLRWYS